MYYTLSPFVLDVNKDLLQSFSLSSRPFADVTWGEKENLSSIQKEAFEKGFCCCPPFFIGFYLLQIVNIDIDLDH